MLAFALATALAQDSVGERLLLAHIHRSAALQQGRQPSEEQRSKNHPLIRGRWELRAATTLAKHWRSEDRHADAYNILEPAYNWFTEGFDTRDLKATKVLFEELKEGLESTR